MRTLLLLFLALPLGASAVSAQGKASDQNVIDSLMAQGQQWLETFRISAHPADARRARDAFREVLQRTRDHAPAHLGLGLVHTTLEGMALPEAMGDVRGLSNHSLAIRHLHSALENGSRDAAIY